LRDDPDIKVFDAAVDAILNCVGSDGANPRHWSNDAVVGLISNYEQMKIEI